METETKPEIDWKEFSRLMLIGGGIIPATQYAVKFTANEVDDMALDVTSKVVEYFFPAPEKKDA